MEGCISCEAWLKRVQDLVPKVALESSTVKVFLARWRMLSYRLEQLPCLLADLRGSIPPHGGSVLCSEMLTSMTKSLEEARDLACQCKMPSYGGKLQMQSRLDSLITALDGYIHDSKLLIESAALLCKSDAAAAPKEGRKCTAMEMLSRLQIGGTDARVKALESLLNFMGEDDKNVLAVAAAPGGVAALVRLLDSGAPVVRETAATALSILAAEESCAGAVASEGAAGPLVRLLDRGAAGEAAARALQGITGAGGAASAENARIVAAHGGAAQLVALCRGGTPSGQAAASAALRNLSVVAEPRRRLAEEEDGIQVLLSLVVSGTAQSRENAAATLESLAAADEETRKKIVMADGVEALVRFLDHADTPSSQEAGIGALRRLIDSESSALWLIEAGFLRQISGFLSPPSSSSPGVQKCAALAILDLAAASAEARRLIGEAGCLSQLVRLLEAKAVASQEIAARALAKLLEVEGNRRAFAMEERGVQALVGLLDEDHLAESAAAIAALSLLAGTIFINLSEKQTSKNRKLMISSGAVQRLSKLADMEVAGAKKLLERLERGGKLRNLFKRLDISTDH